MKSLLKPYLPFLAALVSGLLAALAFPPFVQTDTVWFAFVPLLIVLRASGPKRGFQLGFTSGMLFWLIDLAWLWNLKDNGGPIALVILGHIFLSAYCALYTGLFGFCVSGIWSVERRKPRAIVAGLLAVAVEPLLWIGCEYLRGIILTGFPWNPLAASQYKNLALLSCISLGGVGVLSGLMIAVNAGIASMLFRIWRDVFAPRFVRDDDTPTENAPSKSKFAIRSAELAIALIAVVICWSDGIAKLKSGIRRQKSAATLRASIIHPDSPCIFERDDDSVKAANQTLLDLTELSSDAQPDVCLWPETSLPGYIPYDKDGFEMVTNAVDMLNGAPLLVGAVELRYLSESSDSDYNIYNSAFLFGRSGGIRALYRKQHLVPFGEYIPLETKIPFLKRLAPTGFSCTAGTDSGIFAIDKATGTNSTERIRFNAAALICFEDAFPYLARQAANEGADMLAILANDAWFDGSPEPEQHLAQAVLRCVENSRPMIRCTNRGVSAAIDSCGRILRRVGDGRGAGYMGFAVHEIPVVHNAVPTTYSRYGDWLLHIPAAIITCLIFIAALLFN